MSVVIEITYLISSIFFIFGIKYLGSPKTARKGNLFAAIGMADGDRNYSVRSACAYF